MMSFERVGSSKAKTTPRKTRSLAEAQGLGVLTSEGSASHALANLSEQTPNGTSQTSPVPSPVAGPYWKGICEQTPNGTSQTSPVPSPVAGPYSKGISDPKSVSEPRSAKQSEK